MQWIIERLYEFRFSKSFRSFDVVLKSGAAIRITDAVAFGFTPDRLGCFGQSSSSERIRHHEAKFSEIKDLKVVDDIGKAA